MAYIPCRRNRPNIEDSCPETVFAGVDRLAVLLKKSDVTLQRGATWAESNNVVSIATTENPSIIVGKGQPAFQVTQEYDPASNTYTKTVTFTVWNSGGIFSSKFINDLQNEKDGWVLLIKRKFGGKTNKYIVLGGDTGLKMTASLLDYNDEATDGHATITLTETGARPEVTITYRAEFQFNALVDKAAARTNS